MEGGVVLQEGHGVRPVSIDEYGYRLGRDNLSYLCFSIVYIVQIKTTTLYYVVEFSGAQRSENEGTYVTRSSQEKGSAIVDRGGDVAFCVVGGGSDEGIPGRHHGRPGPLPAQGHAHRHAVGACRRPSHRERHSDEPRGPGARGAEGSPTSRRPRAG